MLTEGCVAFWLFTALTLSVCGCSIAHLFSSVCDCVCVSERKGDHTGATTGSQAVLWSTVILQEAVGEEMSLFFILEQKSGCALHPVNFKKAIPSCSFPRQGRTAGAGLLG